MTSDYTRICQPNYCQESIHKDVVMYSAIIHTIFKGRVADDGYGLYSEIIAKGIFHNLLIYNSLVYGFFIADNLPEAIGFVNEMILNRLGPTRCRQGTYCPISCEYHVDSRNVIDPPSEEP
ncbi:uncharacterized protein HKW66_Vig0224070 [Vigna angularis]|uniref:Pentatricopeptide repeat-containing protein n=2 Tax=Phaseolus angularis TaxID=3914 RepID=A0A8T0JZK9_PHAAN|nr:uncharacterized protein HKW66_Vig0224070 [Vigna angularis]BAT82468.1 hypothetical protein VIGAN_03249200 [Vigna angularis var. angularis]